MFFCRENNILHSPQYVSSFLFMYIYGACGILIALAFFPKLTGALMLIPEPVLGAILLYSVTYIMAGGFSSIALYIKFLISSSSSSES